MKKEENLQIAIPAMHREFGVDALGEDLVLFDETSTLPDLEFPTRLDAALLAVCLQGSTNVNINLRDYALQQGDMLVLLPDQIVQRKDANIPGKYIIVGLSRQFVNTFGVDIQSQLNLFFYVQSAPVTRLTADEMELFEEYHNFIRRRLRDSKSSFRKEVSDHLLYAWFHEVLAIMERHNPQVRKQQSRREELFEQFLRLVSQNYKKERFVLFYADKLCVTPKYLSQVVRSVSGMSANEWINRNVVIEAQMLLKNTSMTIQEISDILGFPNQSFFGRYFKKHVGFSPKEFRS